MPINAQMEIASSGDHSADRIYAIIQNVTSIYSTRIPGGSGTSFEPETRVLTTNSQDSLDKYNALLQRYLSNQGIEGLSIKFKPTENAEMQAGADFDASKSRLEIQIENIRGTDKGESDAGLDERNKGNDKNKYEQEKGKTYTRRQRTNPERTEQPYDSDDITRKAGHDGDHEGDNDAGHSANQIVPPNPAILNSIDRYIINLLRSESSGYNRALERIKEYPEYLKNWEREKFKSDEEIRIAIIKLYKSDVTSVINESSLINGLNLDNDTIQEIVQKAENLDFKLSEIEQDEYEQLKTEKEWYDSFIRDKDQFFRDNPKITKRVMEKLIADDYNSTKDRLSSIESKLSLLKIAEEKHMIWEERKSEMAKLGEKFSQEIGVLSIYVKSANFYLTVFDYESHDFFNDRGINAIDVQGLIGLNPEDYQATAEILAYLGIKMHRLDYDASIQTISGSKSGSKDKVQATAAVGNDNRIDKKGRVKDNTKIKDNAKHPMNVRRDLVFEIVNPGESKNFTLIMNETGLSRDKTKSVLDNLIKSGEFVKLSRGIYQRFN